MQEHVTRRTLATLQSLAMLILILLLNACAITSNDLLPRNSGPPLSSPVWAGSVNVQANVRGTLSAWADSAKFEAALKTAIAQKGLFLKIEQGHADYVLDMWIELQSKGGVQFTPIAVMDSVWRLTRVKDGKVLVCERDHSEGTSGRMVIKIREAANVTMQKILSDLADQSTAHLSALSVAGLRPSMGPVVPEGLVPVVEKIRQNWPKLSMGMNTTEVQRLLGPVLSDSLAQISTKGATEEYVIGLYRLVFISGKLSNWELMRYAK
jgi:hypothetical protein